MQNTRLFVFFVFSAVLSLFLWMLPSCTSSPDKRPPYQVDKNSYYQDLIWELSIGGKIEISPAKGKKNSETKGREKRVMFSKDIRPVDMMGAEKFITRHNDLVMEHPGEIFLDLYLPRGENKISVQARGMVFEGDSTRMRVDFDDSELGQVDVLTEFDAYVFPLQLEKGKHRISISCLNGDQHRKLIITNVRVDRAGFDHSEFVQMFRAVRRLDDPLNDSQGVSPVIMGKMNSVSRRSLFLHSPSLAETKLTVPEDAVLQFSAGIDEFVWDETTAECAFQVFFMDKEKDHLLYREIFRPNKNKKQRQWTEVNIDLAEFQNKEGILRFETNPSHSDDDGDNSSLGYFLLSNPRIISPIKADEPNIVLISIDTLRRDHLSTYGYEKDTSPYLDSLASEAAVFENAIAQAPYTVTSHITMMTSLWPSVHQILTHDYQERLSSKWLTLPQILKARGYQTAGFTGGGQVSAVYGFDRGMDVYDFEGGRSELIFPKAMEWMAKTRGQPFFLFLHTYDVHMPYEPPPPYDSIFDPEYSGTVERWTEGCKKIIDPELFTRIVDLYDGEIRYVDAQIHRVIRFLHERGFYENTMLIITSDHGEEFMERGSMACHAHTLYNELLLIPLIVKFPKGQWAGRTIPDPVALNDLLPTVLDYTGIPLPPHTQGESLLDYLEGNVTHDVHRPIFSEQIVIRDDPRVEVSVQNLSEKYYQRLDLPGEYFHLVDDPGEKHNLMDTQKRKASALEKTIRNYLSVNAKLARMGSEIISTRSQEWDAKTLEKLKALGYIK